MTISQPDRQKIEDKIKSFESNFRQFHAFARIKTKGKGQQDIYQNIANVREGLGLLGDNASVYLRSPVKSKDNKDLWLLNNQQALSFLCLVEASYYPTAHISPDKKLAFLDLEGRKVDFLKLMVDFDYERQHFAGIKVISDQNILGYPTYDRDGSAEFIRDGIYVDLHFRKDRRWQINWALYGKRLNFLIFPVKNYKHLKFIHMRPDKKGPFVEKKQTHVVFPDIEIKNTIGETLSKLGLKQFRVAEKEKFSHITEFLNGGRSVAFDGEKRVLVPSPKVDISYAEKPEMSAYEITEELVDALKKQKYHFFVVNYANPDMVGHTGDLEAAVNAIAHVDKNLLRVCNQARKQKVNMIIVADHGNSDQMMKDGEPHTQHTTNPVPFVYVPADPSEKVRFNAKGSKTLAGVAPSLLTAMGIQQPQEMNAVPLISMEHKPAPGEYQKAMLVVLDGLGLNPDKSDNSDAVRVAIKRGAAPLLRRLLGAHWEQGEGCTQFEADERSEIDPLISGFLMTQIGASEDAVGLPLDQFGNSEVGHTHIGAGRTKENVATDFGRVTAAIEDGSFAAHVAFDQIQAGDHITVSIILSDGGVHSYIEHLREFLKVAKNKQAGRVVVHAALDGRDVDARSAHRYLDWAQQIFDQEGIGEFGLIYGRELHDRAQKFYITEALYRLSVFGEIFDHWPTESGEDSYILTKLRESIMDLSKYSGRVAFVQADLEIDMNDDKRREITLKTIIDLSHAKAKIIVGSHDKGHGNSAAPYLKKALNGRSIYLEKGFHTTQAAQDFIHSTMNNGDVLFLNSLLEEEGESANDPVFAQKLFDGVDVYFSDNPRIAHFKYTSVFAAPQHIPRAAGYNLEVEMKGVESIRDEGQEIAVIGGPNIGLKLDSMERLLKNKITKNILLGADIALIFRKAQGFNNGDTYEEIEPDDVSLVEKLLKFDQGNDNKFMLPKDLVIVNNIENPTDRKHIDFSAPIPEGHSVVDIGPETINLYRQQFIIAKSIYWNGQMGYYKEPQLKEFASDGTQMIAQALKGVSGNVISTGFHTEEITNYFDLKFNSVLSSLASRMLKGGAWPAYEALSSAIEGENIFPPNKLTYDYLNRVIKVEDYKVKHKIAVDTKINKLDYDRDIRTDGTGRISFARIIFKIRSMSEESAEIFIVTEGIKALASIISRDFPRYKTNVSDEPTLLQVLSEDYRRGEKSLYGIALELTHRDISKSIPYKSSSHPPEPVNQD